MPTRSQSEEEYLRNYDANRYRHPSLAVDIVLLSIRDGDLVTLLVRRDSHPFQGQWVLPGGFVQMEEGLDDAAARVLQQKAKLKNIFLEQLYTFGAVDRDPRTRVVSVVYLALISTRKIAEIEENLAENACISKVIVPWKGEEGGSVRFERCAAGLPSKALRVGFDHASIVGTAVQRLRGKIDYAPIAYHFLPKEFTLLELQQTHECILGGSMNKNSFRRRMLASNQLVATGKQQSDTAHRPAELYRLNSRAQKSRAHTRRKKS